jgi:hypothetical protein
MLFVRKDRWLVSIVIPIYKAIPSIAEIKSFRQCLTVFVDYPIFIVVPKSLDVSFYLNLATNKVAVERFEDTYFKDISGYNKLVLSKAFYLRFQKATYMLLYQLDAFVFKDSLKEWCLKEYDYVAAPWMDMDFVRRFWSGNSKIGKWLDRIGVVPNVVGNGGFSLRKIRTAILLLTLFKHKSDNWDSNEDIFWSLYVPYYYPLMRVPSKREALKFAFETQPRQCYVENEYTLPMGCHGWEKYEPQFWAQFIT